MSIASGTFGCPWEISDAGVLTIGAGTLAPNSIGITRYYPWVRDYSEQITSVVVQSTVRCNGDTTGLFSQLKNATSIDISGLDTSNATSLADMFSACFSLTSLDISGLDTRNVTSMRGMFGACRSLTSLDVSTLNTSNVTTMNGMFSNCEALTTLDVSTFDTSKVNDMMFMFYRDHALTTLDLSAFDTSNVTNMIAMFGDCPNLVTLDISTFDTSSLNLAAQMFQDCPLWTGCDFPAMRNLNTSDGGLDGYRNMFYGCNSADVYIVPSGSATAAFWRSVASEYSNVHYYVDDAVAPTSAITATRCDSTGTEDDEGTYAKLSVSDTLQNTLIPYSLRPNAVSSRTTRLDNTSISPTWSGSIAIVNVGDTSAHTFTYAITDRAGKTSNPYTAILTSAAPALDLCHGVNDNGIAFGKVATREGVVDSAWDYWEHGRRTYPLFVYDTKPANADAPILPCFILDKSNSSLWYYD